MQGRVARQAESLFQWRAARSEDRVACPDLSVDAACDSVELAFVLADPSVSLADLFNLAPGDVLLLDEGEGTPLSVELDGDPWGAAVIGWDGDEPAVRLIKDEA